MPSPADALVWPHVLLQLVTVKADIVGSTIAPGQTGSGAYPYARLDGGGLWSLTLNSIRLANADAVRAWRAIRMLAQGGVRPIVVPRRDVILRPLPKPLPLGAVAGPGQKDPAYAPIAHSDGTLYADGTGYRQPLIVARLAAAAALRDTTVRITLLQGAPLRGGECFSLLHPVEGHRMYEVTTVSVSGGTTTCTIEPPLRDAIAGGAPVELDYPKGTYRLAKPDAMDIELSTFPYPRPSVSFLEYASFTT